jgi:tripartite-type tricarboxylate transporter receptor subunit TctC
VLRNSYGIAVMNILRRKFLYLAAGAAVLLGPGEGAFSQARRTIKLIVPFAAGGGADILGRLLAEQIGAEHGVSIVIENRPGAGTVIGTEAVARAVPDANTLLIVTDSFLVTPQLRKLSYDPLLSFEPVCNLAATPQVFVANKNSPYRTLADLIEDARRRPDALTIASPGPASAAHVAIELLMAAANVRMTYVPYPGIAPALTALLGDHLTAALSTHVAVAEHLQNGTLRALAAASARRIPSLPEVATAAEFGFADLDADLWYGLYAPAKTPAAKVSELAEWFAAALNAPEIKPRLAAQGLAGVGMCGTQFSGFLRREFEKYGRGIRQGNVRAE